MPLILNCAVDFECGRIQSKPCAVFPKTDEARPANNIVISVKTLGTVFPKTDEQRPEKNIYLFFKKIVIADSLLNTELHDGSNDVEQNKNDTPVSSICQLGIITDFPHKETPIVPQLKA